ncbi:uncharacterized protein LOC111046104 [Nilaparvata lugens]|uniref:uncharacterized protein LOC111046104 n=1 Tax=Nilaparvata lugens TaxID=108931 RepID=UPI00193E51F5|nr:uncharacterized protein LOC111046104 [Nilaparvata lugens]XP_039289015.1 uncharacterized protein LOC111046104 [Nilaparvata lugens]XP_039289016.1 uncharacterized protein LOC111046104 [Nilaparvata lugens]XP_039289017.1 uncharacterized protein LOC111046104 [Nilaparvata lugens]XP_039289018.1 uncharacterized protein LOC111046104 [Nilaparvata lugens]XP_039289019.1 uncharacterized protein LOC111046104 [Nilaparvata lugens]XP_039289020.1 uncharacterized protein LOC111046104 [Nilaparvata lugens]
MESIPEFVNAELLTEALNSSVTEIEVKPALGRGENYLSRLYRIRINYASNPVEKLPETVIVKLLPVGYLETFVNENGMLEKEIKMYTDYLPLVKLHLGRNLAPESFKVTRKDMLMLEDLSLDGYKMKDRILRLDRYHAEAAVKILAEFHSTSIFLREKNSEILEEVSKESQFHNETPTERDFIVNRFNMFMIELRKYPHLKKYADLFHDTLGADMWSRFMEEMRRDCKWLKVLNHGDFWTNNILFKHDGDGKILDLKLVDFQFTRFVSPAMDLQLFFVTSLSDRSDIGHLTETYRVTLNSKLPSTITPLGRAHIQAELDRFETFGFIVAACFLPGAVINRQQIINYDDTTEEQFSSGAEESPHNFMYRDATYLSMIEPLLMHYHGRGLL